MSHRTPGQKKASWDQTEDLWVTVDGHLLAHLGPEVQQILNAYGWTGGNPPTPSSRIDRDIHARILRDLERAERKDRKLLRQLAESRTKVPGPPFQPTQATTTPGY
jgi:hypothetical protein